jgi:hypothetical protein
MMTWTKLLSKIESERFHVLGLAVCYGVPTRQAGDGLQVFQDLYGAESIVESTVLKVT